MFSGNDLLLLVCIDVYSIDLFLDCVVMLTRGFVLVELAFVVNCV